MTISASPVVRTRPMLAVLVALCAPVVCALPALAGDEGPQTPPEIVAAAPPADWVAIAPSDLVVIDLAADAGGKARRVVIQLVPAPFVQGWVGNIRKLIAAHWWDGTSINRVQDNYVVQWGDPDGDDRTRAKPLPPGLIENPEGSYVAPIFALPGEISGDSSNLRADPYAPRTGFWRGWPVGADQNHVWPLHCYGTIGVGRDNPPDTGSGAELYAVIGQAPRQLDRNLAVVGRVIDGIENLSSLPRGTGPIGFYATPGERVPIRSVRLGGDVANLPSYQTLSTTSASFARFVSARANRRDRFFVSPAGGVDVCNVPVPVRRAK